MYVCVRTFICYICIYTYMLQGFIGNPLWVRLLGESIDGFGVFLSGSTRLTALPGPVLEGRDRRLFLSWAALDWLAMEANCCLTSALGREVGTWGLRHVATRGAGTHAQPLLEGCW